MLYGKSKEWFHFFKACTRFSWTIWNGCYCTLLKQKSVRLSLDKVTSLSHRYSIVNFQGPCSTLNNLLCILMPTTHKRMVCRQESFNDRHLLSGKEKKNISDCNCLLGAQCFKSRKKRIRIFFYGFFLMQKLLPSMPSHFSKELFFIKHKVTGCWKRNNVTVNLSTHRPAAWLKHHALIPLCCVCNGQMLFADEEGVPSPSTCCMKCHIPGNFSIWKHCTSGTNIFYFESCIGIADYSPAHSLIHLHYSFDFVF